MRRPWFYFGCHGDSGHYLFDERMLIDHRSRLSQFDGSLCGPVSDGLYVAALTRLGGLGYTALAFWDQTGDTRPGSNSIFFAPSLRTTPAGIMVGVQRLFPQVHKRLPPIDLTRAEDQATLMLPAPSPTTEPVD